ncbi:uncharacterized protein LOC143229534 isoform X2 [Tachypleus tridentatus]|uniref:uncharacterized protein LOC143229534 isoform X2 n=1 Tax=Tachypleus tridentatus TaxID=6853 RepID=UPI003FD3E897
MIIYVILLFLPVVRLKLTTRPVNIQEETTLLDIFLQKLNEIPCNLPNNFVVPDLSKDIQSSRPSRNVNFGNQLSICMIPANNPKTTAKPQLVTELCHVIFDSFFNLCNLFQMEKSIHYGQEKNLIPMQNYLFEHMNIIPSRDKSFNFTDVCDGFKKSRDELSPVYLNNSSENLLLDKALGTYPYLCSTLCTPRENEVACEFLLWTMWAEKKMLSYLKFGAGATPMSQLKENHSTTFPTQNLSELSPTQKKTAYEISSSEQLIGSKINKSIQEKIQSSTENQTYIETFSDSLNSGRNHDSTPLTLSGSIKNSVSESSQSSVDEIGKKMVSSEDSNAGGGYIRNNRISENSHSSVDEIGKKKDSIQQDPSKFPNEQDLNAGEGYIKNSTVLENSQSSVDEMSKKLASGEDSNAGGGYIRNDGILDNSQIGLENENAQFSNKQLDQDTQAGVLAENVNQEDEQWDFTEKDADDEDDDLLYMDGKLSNENQNVPKANSGNPTYPKMVEPFPQAEDTHFLAYFLTAVVLCVIAYLAFHNKRKILDLILQGWYPGQTHEVKPLI